MDISIPTTTPLPSEQTTPAKNNTDEKLTGLKQIFRGIVDNKQVNLEIDVLCLILRKELFLNLNTLPTDLTRILPYVLAHYMKTWPGWNKSAEYISGNITFTLWFEKFYSFLTIKMNEAVNIHYAESVQKKTKESEDDSFFHSFINHKETQTEASQSSTAPYQLCISCGPELLSTIAFTEYGVNNIMMKQHPPVEWSTSQLSTITLKQIINWPHVAVNIWTPVFHFKRKIVHNYKRQICLVDHVSKPNLDEFIEDVQMITPANSSENSKLSYSVDFLKNRIVQFLTSLDAKNLPRLKEQCKTILNEILIDILELNVVNNGKVSMATNTSVLYNIGKCTYFRSKKLSKGILSEVVYTEVIVPRVDLSFVFLAPDDKFYAYLKELKKSAGKSVSPEMLPKINYGCTFCSLLFGTVFDLITHLKVAHKMEREMLCYECKVAFLPFELTAKRWKHNCSKSNVVN